MWFYVLWWEQIVGDGFRWILDGTVYFKVYLELKSLHRHILCALYVRFPQQQQQQQQRGRSNLTQGLIAAAHRRFTRSRQVAPMCIPI